MFGASHRIPPGESTPLVEAHRSDTQPKPTQNTVNDTCEEIFLKILATIKVRSLDYWGHIHVRRFVSLCSSFKELYKSAAIIRWATFVFGNAGATRQTIPKRAIRECVGLTQCRNICALIFTARKTIIAAPTAPVQEPSFRIHFIFMYKGIPSRHEIAFRCNSHQEIELLEKLSHDICWKRHR